MTDRSEVSALLSPSRRRVQRDAPNGRFLSSGPSAATRPQITFDALEDEAFLRTLEEQLQQHVDELENCDLVLGAKQINYLAFRLHEALEPKRDPETNVIQAWTIQPQAQLKIKMSSHIQVLKLSTILREVRRLRIHQQSLLRSPIEMDIFPSLRAIEIVHTEIAVLGNVHFFANQLRQFRLEHTPLESLTQILSPTAATGAPLAVWKKLESLRINCCSLPAVDACLNQLQVVKVVDLAWNEIASFESPATMASLQWLDLCHNKLTAFPPLTRLSNLKVLDLSVNQIQSLEGVQELPALVDLNVANNELRDIGEIELLGGLRELRRLVIRENPISRRPDYRREVLFYLGERIELDDEPWTSVETQSMKTSRQLRMHDAFPTLETVPHEWARAELAIEENVWSQTNGTMMYPMLAKAGGLLAREADIIPPPRMYSPKRRHMQMQAAALSTSRHKLNRIGTRSSLGGTLSEVTEQIDDSDTRNESPIKTVDDFFRLQSVDASTRAAKNSNELDLVVDGLVEHDSDSDSSSENGRNRSRKYTESDFMKDFEEEEAINASDVVVRGGRSSSVGHKHTRQVHSNGGVDVRVLLSAEDAAVFDLTFGIDGLGAAVVVKSNEILERLHVPDRESSIAFSRRLPDVIAIGTSTQSSRAKIIVLKLRKLDHMINSVTYQIETAAMLARLLAPLLGHLYVATPGHSPPATCVCSNCGGISHLSTDFVDAQIDRTGDSTAINGIFIHACLLCTSRNVREISSDRMLAMYTAEGMAHVAKRVKPPTERPAQLEVGFFVEEHELTPREALDVHECVLISSNGIREVIMTTV